MSRFSMVLRSKKLIWQPFIGARLLFWGQCALCLVALVAAFYFQLVADVIPCILCRLERYLLLLILAVVGYGLFLGSKEIAKKIQWSSVAISFLGVCVASRHVWLQSFAAKKYHACIFDLSETTPSFITEITNALFSNAPHCGVVNTTFLGLSLANWSLMLFVALMSLGFLNLILQENKYD